MPPMALNKNRPNTQVENDTDSQNSNTATTRPNTHKAGSSIINKELQEIKDSLDGHKYLKKCSLLCPPGEPPSHLLLSTCLHQISALPGAQKPIINTIRAVAFMLEELEDLQINQTLKDAFDSQINELTSDMQSLLVNDRRKTKWSLQKAASIVASNISSALAPTQLNTPTNTYALALINPPPHANPKLAAREGIKARQFALAGFKKSKISHLNLIQFKNLLNNVLVEIGLTTGKISSVTNICQDGIVIEADSDSMARWLSSVKNQSKLCKKLNPNINFYARKYKIIVFNAPINLDPKNTNHLLEICESNNLETNPSPITSTAWAKAIENRSNNQHTGHLFITFNNQDIANRAITNGLVICNKRCWSKKCKREPLRCLKCQGWNHLTKDCKEETDNCGNCTGKHNWRQCNSMANKNWPLPP